MDGRRLRFFMTLLLFVAWVAALGVLAYNSARRPMPQPTPAAVVPH